MATSPLTGTNDVVLLRSIDARALGVAWLSELGCDVSRELKGHAVLSLYRCNDTGLEFFSPADVAGTPELYGRLQALPWYYQSHKWEHLVALRRLSGRRAILEIGAGDGAFVRLAGRHGQLVEGIELNPDAVRAARGLGVSLHATSLEGFAMHCGRQFDAICSFQVLEHVADPRAFLGHIVDLLSPGGIVLLSVPNNDSYVRQLDGLDLLNMPPHHMTRWTERTFRALPSSLGLSFVCSRCEPLSANNVEHFLSAIKARCRRHPAVRTLLTHPAVEWRLRRAILRLRRFIRGQSLLVQLRRT